MIFFWTTYFFLSFLISFLISLFFKNRFLKVSIFSFFLAILVTVWFKNPGENEIAPILSIFLLESMILENNGYERLLRPLGFIFFLLTIVTLIFWKRKFKN